MIRNLIRQSALALLFLVAVSAVMAQGKVYYVSPTGNGTADGSSWTNTMILTDALTAAKAGDQIWVQGFDQIDNSKKLYIVPESMKATGFTLNSGVQLYGGFKGDETTLDARETLGKPYQLKYRSVLSGDISGNDAVDNTSLIFPANMTRKDNATHVLSLNMDPASGANNNTYPTVVNGFSIGGGQADGENEYGGGIYIYNNSSNTGGGIFRIERCFFVNNYATLGGAIYVTADVQNQNNNISLINQCAIYNNAAGERGAVVNAGGGIYLAGEATVVNSTIFNNENGGIRLSAGSQVVNTTVARNTGAGIDLIQENDGSSVLNSIIWGNTSLFAQYSPQFSHSAYHEVAGDTNNNVYVATENNGDANAPMFDAPSVKTSFDRDFDWRTTAYPLWSWNVLEGSVMHSRGNQDFYNQTIYGSEDMAGNARVNGSTIDIGAYEFQKIPTGRIRYVKPGGTGDGSSWDNASGDLQRMIDELAVSNQPGEVWVAAGTYQPIGWIDTDKNYTAAFRMRDGISVYGGFAGTESSKNARSMTGNMPWQYEYKTILKGASYQDDAVWNATDTKWNVSSSASRHVVWFAPYPYQEDNSFTKVTILDGFTIVGGHAQGDTGINDFRTDCGGGVFMGVNSYLYNCVVKECSAVSDGGGVYTEGGRIMGSLIYNSSADDNGGGVFVDNAGIVLQSMVTNCAATNGGGVYLNRDALWDGKEHPEYLILSTSIVSNNTNRANGAVYCNDGGVILQTMITQNETIRSTDLADRNAARTGGLYINEYALVINSVLWNNQLMGSAAAQMYALNPTQEKVRFYNTAISNFNTSVWNNILQTEILQLADENESGGTDTEGFISPNFTPNDLIGKIGVQSDLKNVAYFWKPIIGSNLRARGRTLGTFPEEVLVAPELDINGELFQQKPSIGSYRIEAGQITPEVRDGGQTLRVYIDADCTVPDHNGNSWAMAYRSLNETLDYFANLQGTVQIGGQTVTISKDTRFEIYVLEGNLWPRYAYTNLDPKTATIDIQASTSGATYYIYGGFRRDENNPNNALYAPLTYRSIINGNIEGKVQEEGIYHCITVAKGAKVLLDGFHVINGYAAGEATRQYGAGLLVHDGAEATVNNCIFENNTAKEGAAIDARNAKLTMNNCVVNNNTNITETSAVINCTNLTMNHVTMVNNVGAAPANMGTSSFSAGNTTGTNSVELESIGANGAKNFANPTNSVGATLGFDTYFGGYSEFRPLTSSTEAGTTIINKASTSTLSSDITIVNDRNLGGAADLGAYEAILPESGVIYVRGTDGNDNNNGNSWGTAYATLTKALEVALSGDKIWVAAGTYTGNIKGNLNNVNDNANIHSQPYAYEMKEGVNVYGGFPNSGTPGEDDRDPNFNETILQAHESLTEFPTVEGDGPTTVGRVVVQPNHFNTETVWDGFTIRNGYLNTHFRFAISGNFLNVQTGLFYNNGTQKGIGHVAGAGAFLMGNGVLENCRIEDNHILAWDRNQINSGGGTHGAGAGVYSIGGVLRNCQVLNNVLKVYSNQSPYSGATVGSAFAYGAGIYMLNDGNYKAAVYNSIVADNILEARVWQGTGAADGGTAVYHTIAIGAGICQVSGDFYNNTIVGNKAYTDNAPRANIICGGLMLYEGAKIYNCIIYNNTGETKRPNNNDGRFGLAQYMNEQLVCLKIKNPGFQGWIDPNDGSTGAADDLGNNGYNLEKASIDIRYSNVGRLNENNQPEKSTFLEYTEGDNQVTYESRHNTHLYPKFVAESGGNYRLDAGSPAINTGTEAIPGVTIPDYDAEYTARIKDCGIDMGAFESTNESNISYTTQTENEQTIGIYYVSQNGAGLRSGENPANAACFMKLQDILTDAGNKVDAGTLTSATVKVAGYENAAYVYHANTLASASDPQSYTYVVPEGVTLMGGYYDGTFSNGVYQNDGWDNATGDRARNPMKYQTVLSAVSEANASTTQTVRGYHAVTFGAWPGTAALEKETIIDGLWLIDGSATSMAGTGNPNTRGGGAIVPSGAHVRNCVVTNCEAIEGGGLYLLPGAMVSGTLVQYNTADQGGGIFADNTGAGADARAHMVSCTVTDNEATEVGGGIFQMEGALMAINSVVWGNTAPSDRNVSSVVTNKYDDNKLLAMVKTMNPAQTDNEYYPYNYCFVETFEMPTTFENTSMTGEGDIYFEDERRLLKVYSPLIKRGMPTEYAEYWESQKVAGSDMRNVLRRQTDYTRADVGAYAYEGGSLPTTSLIKRIFVSKGSNLQLQAGADMEDYLGRSFYTSLNHLDDALEYINRVRTNKTGGADDNTEFEILLGPGIYKPSVQREDAASNTLDQRQNSFDIPVNVKIYGGFSGEEKISTGINTIPASTGNITMTSDGDLPTILGNRTFSDMNGNNIYEPWELEYQSILSGELDVSTTAKNVYHVVYSDAGNTTATTKQVTLDGVTIMGGETSHELSNAENTNEIGRGGGIYTNGVDYTLHRCRLIDNKAVRGGGLYVRSASATLIGCVVSGNGSVDSYTGAKEMRGGGIYASSESTEAFIYAVNSLFANNETNGQGGAIAVGSSSSYVDLMNCNIVRNKAQSHSALYDAGNTNTDNKNKITNCVIWGNEDNDNTLAVINGNAAITYSASEWLATDGNAHNIRLNSENMAIDGPRFKTPSPIAGVAGNSYASLWNPASVSVLADVGNGKKDFSTTEDNAESGAYQAWFDKNARTFQGQYIKDRERYMAPLDEKGNTPDVRIIDIGLFEYPHPTNLSNLDAVYVATEDAGLANGTSWANAISNLKQAIIALANPTGNQGTTEKKIYVRNGTYSMAQLSHDNVAFPLYMSNSDDHGQSLEIFGACTGVGHTQDFSNPTLLTNSPLSQNTTNILLDISTGSKPVTVSGFTFANTSQGDGTTATQPGKGVNLMKIGSGGKVTLKNVAFRNNYGYGVSTVTNSGELLLVNALFADGAYTEGSTGVGLQAKGTTTVVNATFAQNRRDIDAGTGSTLSVYNSTSWNNTVQKLPTGYANVSFDSDIQNNDVQNGPNFVDPDHTDVLSRDYNIRPSKKLLNQGVNDLYTQHALGNASGTAIPATETDLGNHIRLTDATIDVGAYEYNAKLQPIIYVKPVVGGKGDGSSWTDATRDFQGAVDLASVYSANNGNATGYVFVHNSQPMNNTLRVSMPGAKVYGGMNDELTDKATTEDQVADLLSKRQGMLQASQRSKIAGGIQITAASLVDGFEITGDATVSGGGMLSTSIVNGTVTGSQTTLDGLLYNSLVLGSVSDVKAVNVTATGTIADITSYGNNRASATGNNTYVTDDYWKYQLMETSTDIDAGTIKDLKTYTDLVGHSRDLIGNARIRNTVDNGCFETWNISSDYAITADDYPVGKSVVYVRKGQELSINDGVYPNGNAFNPGFLLLEHQAGLRGNGNYISLNNNFAMERNVPGNGSDLANIPFNVQKIEKTAEVITYQIYNGATRAGYDYKFESSGGEAWEALATVTDRQALALNNSGTDEVKVRFYGNSYEENGTDKTISLQKYNFNDPWTTDDPGTGNRFTHKENMSWNLFGSPYLCAMNYSDLEYGRVLYGYNGSYQPVNTAVETDRGGHIPAGSAVFTQTATLKDAETFAVAQPKGEKSGTAFSRFAPVQVVIESLSTTKSADQSLRDDIGLSTVTPEFASTQFDLGSDGVKWMAGDETIPQIYMQRDGGRYSLLSAVNVEGSVEVGVRVGEPGDYLLYLPEKLDLSDYSSILLTDRHAGKMVDLKQGSYAFTATRATDMEGRFSLSFNRSIEAVDLEVKFYSPTPGVVIVEGLPEHARVNWYTTMGRLVEIREAANWKETFYLRSDIYMMEVYDMEGKERIGSYKVRVR